MPLLKLETNVVLAEEKERTLLAALSKITAESIGKPERYVMVTIESASVLMSGESGDAAFVDVRSIGGLGSDVNHRLAQRVSKLLKETLGIPGERVYLNFTDVPAARWGWNGETFG